MTQVCDDPGDGLIMSTMDSLLYNSDPTGLAGFYQGNSNGRVHFGRDTSTIVNVRQMCHHTCMDGLHEHRFLFPGLCSMLYFYQHVQA